MALDPRILDKLIRYCSYRERAISEAKSKLAGLGISSEKQGEYLEELKEEGYLDEERFVSSFIQGKLRIKGWGRHKIRMHLMHKKVAAPLIDKYLQEVEQEEYMARIKELAERKMERVKGANDYEKKAKVFRYLQQKGFEASLIHQVVFE